MNKVTISGMVQDVPVYQTTQSGKGLLKFTVMVRRDYKNKDGKYENDYLRVTAFGRTADFAGRNLDKGCNVIVDGKLQTGSYEKDGVKHYTTDVIANDIEVPYGKHAMTLVAEWNKEREARLKGENYSGAPDPSQIEQAQQQTSNEFVEVEDDGLPF